ncbi:hypothetical protein WJX74_009310 [Apatococcus lobatus]|uniref:DNA-directed RNA polymerase III subunit n=1 Tax=Apatococcus lobatus TaxID=904363 RepID=A0AAW1PRT2_9CHLO
MAARGRGRGGFRGRGRGGVGPPVAKDDDGNIVSSQVEGPPPLYPELEKLPKRPEISPRDKRLLARHRALNKFYKNSPYFLKRNHEQSGADGVLEKIDDLAGISKKRKEEQPLQLSDVMILHPKYFPQELLGKNRTAGSSATKQQQFWAAQQKDKDMQGKDLEATFADLAKKEAAAAKAGKDGTGSKNAINEDDEEKRANAEEEVAEEDEEDGYGHDDDDYLQGQDYQDDEEYGDEEAGGDEAYF